MSISQINAQSMQLRAVAALRHTSASVKSLTGAGAGSPRQADTVELSASARALAGAAQMVAGAADVREDRVAAIKAALADGSYKVDSRTLARSMVRAGVGS